MELFSKKPRQKSEKGKHNSSNVPLWSASGASRRLGYALLAVDAARCCHSVTVRVAMLR